jgi:hypothetical protein
MTVLFSQGMIMMTVMDWLCRFYIGLESPVSPRCSPSGTMGSPARPTELFPGLTAAYAARTDATIG